MQCGFLFTIAPNQDKNDTDCCGVKPVGRMFDPDAQTTGLRHSLHMPEQVTSQFSRGGMRQAG